jgi:predicted HicB family RNase H-like nuclease
MRDALDAWDGCRYARATIAGRPRSFPQVERRKGFDPLKGHVRGQALAMGNASKGVQSINRDPSSLAIDHAIALRKSGLIISGPMTYDRWELAGHSLISFSESTAWWIADWLVYGEGTFHERYREAIERTSLSYQTLRNYKWVARRFELSRRRDSLSFGHHSEVAMLDPPEQDYWLRKAEELGWSRNQLRNNVRASLKEQQRLEENSDSPCMTNLDECRARSHATAEIDADWTENKLILRLTPDQITQFTVVADERQLSLDEWAIQVLETAASDRVSAARVARV